MDALIMPITLLVIMIIFGIVFLIISKKREERFSTTTASKDSGKSSNKGTTGSESNAPEIKKEDVFKFMEFDRILDDMIVQNKGTRFTMAIKCKGINYDLMSDMEQLSVEEGFITFLNTLRFPIQLYVQAQNIDLKSAISKYKENISGIRDEFEKLDYQYTKTMEAFDSTTEEIEKVEKERNEVLNVYEYASDIINYVERMSYNKSLLQRNFYVLISYNTSEVSAGDKFSKDELIRICYNELLTRCHNVISGLASSSVEGRVLNSNELADLLYTAYNRDDKSLLSVKEAIESGFYRLYSTSEDAFIKKKKMLSDEIQNEAKIRALVALRDAIQNDTYMSPKVETIVNQEEISRKASEIVAREGDIPPEIKKKAQDRIVNDYKNIKKSLLEDIEREKENIIQEANKVEPSSGVQKTVSEDTAFNRDSSNYDYSQNNNFSNNNYSESSNKTSNDDSINDNIKIGYQNEQTVEQRPTTPIMEERSFESEKVNPSEMVKNRMDEEQSDTTSSVQDDSLIFDYGRLGDTSGSDEEDDIII